MRKHAEDIGADGVVNVKLEAIQYADFLEVVAMGTAVKKIVGQNQDDTEVVVSA